MRSGYRVIAIALAGAAMLTISTSPASHAATSSSQSQIAALQAQRAALVVQLNLLLPGRNNAANSLSAAESVYGGAQSKVLAAQATLDNTNVQLRQLTHQIAADQATVTEAKRQLSNVARGTYEDTGSNGVMTAVLDSKTFGAAVQQLQGANTLKSQLNQLQSILLARSAALQQEQAQLNNTAASATAQERALANQSNQFLAVVANRNQAFGQASGPVRALEAQIANIDNQIAALESPGGSVSGGSCGNHFAFGQCTWYVASRRCIPWIGNANQWFHAAASYGYAEGHQPQVGAVVVFWPGGDGASSVGHVGYVEAVGPSGGIPAGQFKLSEMNFAGWDRVSYRVLPNNSPGIQGFIYGKS